MSGHRASAEPRRPFRTSDSRYAGSGRYNRRDSRDFRGRPNRRFGDYGAPPRRRGPVIPPLEGPNAFVELGVPTELAAVLAFQQITEPTPIQLAAIPDALQGTNVLGRGRTGSGKTFTFGLPMLARLRGERRTPGHPRGLILTPTRELAMQVVDALKPLGQEVDLNLQVVMGGGSYERQAAGLQRADIVVATPGRLTDLIERGTCSLEEVKVVVLDEADQMADLGFMPQVDNLMRQIPEGAQTMLFSATLDGDVQALVNRYMPDPVVHETDPSSASVGTMDHHIIVVNNRDKALVAAQIAQRPGRTVAFVRTQADADDLAEALLMDGVRAKALHGGMPQGARTRALNALRSGDVDVLVATDVAARGIHVDDIDLVLHVDPPRGPKEYLHRSGRTARAGATGRVVLLATMQQRRMATAITAKAGVEPTWLRARPGDDSIDELTGADPERRPARIVPSERDDRDWDRDDRGPRGRWDRDNRAPRGGGWQRDDRGPRGGWDRDVHQDRNAGDGAAERPAADPAAINAATKSLDEAIALKRAAQREAEQVAAERDALRREREALAAERAALEAQRNTRPEGDDQRRGDRFNDDQRRGGQWRDDRRNGQWRDDQRGRDDRYPRNGARRPNWEGNRDAERGAGPDRRGPAGRTNNPSPGPAKFRKPRHSQMRRWGMTDGR